MKQKTKRNAARLTAFLLTVVMLLSSVTTAVFATEEQEIIIASQEDYDAFVAAVNGNDTYEGKTVVLQADVTATTPLKAFSGIFDGNGHTITADNIQTANKMYAGVFNKNNGTIRNLRVDGSVSGKMYCAAICAYNNGTIDSCVNEAAGTFAGSYVGGIAGFNKGTVSNCINRGTITCSATSGYCGGMVGSNGGTVENCYNIGTVGGTSSKAFPVVGASTKTVTNCYYLSGSGAEDVKATAKTEAEMKTAAFAEALGSAFTAVANGYPVLSWEADASGGSSETYTVTFMDGETVLSQTSVTKGEPATEPGAPTKDGYVFLYWSVTEDGEKYDFSTILSADLTLYAVWEAENTDWEYEVINDGTEIKLTKYKGTASTVVVPEKLLRLPVTVLGNQTFAGNTNVTYVTMLQTGITLVEDGSAMAGTGAFSGCANLRTVILPETLTRIADYMFYGMNSANSETSSYRINIGWPEASITEIGDYAFSCCNGIVELTLPESVTTIGQGAFYQARRLATLDMPGVCRIGADAFTETIFEETYENLWEAGEFSGIVYADKVAYLYMGENGEEMPADTELILKDGTKGVSEFLLTNHFTDSTSCREHLKSVTVPASVSYIAPDTFDGCKAVVDGDFTGMDIYGLSGSYAERFASEHSNLRFQSIGTNGSYDYDALDYAWYDNAAGRSYIISNVNELRAFEDILDIGEDDFAGATVTLAADIDLGGLTQRGSYGIEGYGWTRLEGFAGTFDGDGHTISGVYQNTPEDKAGFFGTITGTAVIKNLTVKGKILGRDYVGGIVGEAASGAVLENCVFDGSVSGQSDYGYVGGIAGKALKATVRDCTVYGAVTCSMNYAAQSLQQGYVGGIVGWNLGSNIANCTNYACVTGDGYGTGGITGFSQLATVRDCVNRGDIIGNENVGGIAGKLTLSTATTCDVHSGCRNEGSVRAELKAGGIVGTVVGVVTVDGEYLSLRDCSNTGKVYANNHAAGIAGYIHDAVISRCSNEGEISALGYAGGIGGYALGCRVQDCYNLGKITAEMNYAGGLLGLQADNECTLTNCYHAGEVITSGENKAPLGNILNGEAAYSNCYYLDDSDTAEASAKSSEAFANGEVAYLLGDAFGQRLGTDAFPLFRTAENAVYRYTECDGTTYSYTNDAEMSDTVVAHTWNDGEVTRAATCTEVGVRTYTCTVCKQTKDEDIPATGHSFSETWSMDGAQHWHECACGETSDLAPHEWDSGETVKEATWTQDGEVRYTCTVCGSTKTEAIPAEGHCDGGEGCPAAVFTDVEKNAWYHEAVDFNVSHGLFHGTGKETFEPETAVTRAMFVTVLWRCAGMPQAGSNPFTDVGNNMWYTDAIAWAAQNDVVNGVGGGRFAPEESVTREQMAAILYRYAGKCGYDTDARAELADFPDAAAISSYAEDAVRWAVAVGIINGSDGNLVPQGAASRAQAAAMLMRFVRNIAQKAE